jgi:hypothetical protein
VSSARKTDRKWTEAQRAAHAARAAERQARRLEDLEWLIPSDNNAESVARRAGFVNADAALRWCARMGRHDLASMMHPYVGAKDIYHPDYRSNNHFGNRTGAEA